jgi:hypothetical protein
LSIGPNGHAKDQWTFPGPFDKWNVQWPFDFSIGHLAWVLDINKKSVTTVQKSVTKNQKSVTN